MMGLLPRPLATAVVVVLFALFSLFTLSTAHADPWAHARAHALAHAHDLDYDSALEAFGSRLVRRGNTPGHHVVGYERGQGHVRKTEDWLQEHSQSPPPDISSEDHAHNQALLQKWVNGHHEHKSQLGNWLGEKGYGSVSGKRGDVVSGKDIKDDKCAICLDDLRNKQRVIAVEPCQHQFHDKCLTRLEDSPLGRTARLRCPICKRPLSGDGHSLMHAFQSWAAQDGTGSPPEAPDMSFPRGLRAQAGKHYPSQFLTRYGGGGGSVRDPGKRREATPQEMKEAISQVRQGIAADHY